MPLYSNSNNRVLPSNARTADVARATLEAVIPMHQRRVDAAFQVNGYNGVLYSYLTSGLKCACQAKGKALNSRLDANGKASSGAINELLVPGKSFGVRPYNTTSKSTTAQNAAEAGFLEIKIPGSQFTPVPLGSLFDEDDLDTATRAPTAVTHDRVSPSAGLNADVSNVLLEEDPFAAALGHSDFDSGLFGYSDVSCPVCFGSGYVGGYSILSGKRIVVNFQDPTIQLPANAVIFVENEFPSVTTTTASWTLLLPAGCIGVDTLRLWNGSSLVQGGVIKVDDVALTKKMELLTYCNGRNHAVSVEFTAPTEFTHLEIQLNQSIFQVNFELPVLTKGNSVSLREHTEPFQVLLSPRVPGVKSMDVLVESTFGRALQVKSVSGMTDRSSASVSGWSADVRPAQPQELFWMLPRRGDLPAQNKPMIVRDNSSPNLSYTRT